MDQLSLGPATSEPTVVTSDAGHLDSPCLIYQSANTEVHLHHGVGIKLIRGSAPSEEHTLRLVHEQNISNFLPSSCPKREVLRVQSFNGCPALYFKWCGGLTLRQWLRNVESGQQVNLNVRLRAAVAVAKTLHEFHSNGVSFGSLTPENIVLDTHGSGYKATFVDLSESMLIDDFHLGSEALAKAAKEKDLQCFGLVLNELLRGEEAAIDEGFEWKNIERDNSPLDLDSYGDQSRRKRGKQPITVEGLPCYLASLISTLLLTGRDRYSHSCLYSSALDVYQDLKFATEHPSACNREGSLVEGRLDLNRNMFHGRQVEMSMLKHLLQSVVVSGNPSMAVIAGSPGTGKSTLVHQLKKSVLKNGFFIEGKFNNSGHNSVRPDTILVSALNSFFGNLIISRKGNEKTSIRWKIHDAIGSIGSGSNALMDIIPNLRKLLVENPDQSTVLAENCNSIGKMGASQRLKFMICKLIGAIAGRSNPIVLFLDDLQWADEMTLDVMRMIMTDPDISHFLFLGCYRENEVNATHPLLLKLRGIRDQGINVVTIKIGPIEKESANSLISEALSLPPSLCRSLSTIVHSKTGGIILFMIKFLTSLSEEGLLWCSLTSRRWEFDLDAIRLKEISDDVVQHMTKSMARLSKQMQSVLKIAACLGTSFHEDVISKAEKDSELSIKAVLDSCVDGGFLQYIDSSKYVWAHDQVKDAAYMLIPLPKRESFHLLLGSRLFINTCPREMDSLIFYIVDNMNYGLKLIQNADQKYEVSSLNLQAGEKAISSSAFHSAAKYLKTGISLLGQDCWEYHYTLSIKLHDAVSEALFVTGDFLGLKALIEKPLTFARCFEDKLNIYNNLVRTLAASGQLDEGLTKCVSILNQLGEAIPTNITEGIYQDEVARVQQMLREKTHSELLCLPVMTDSSKLATMQFLNHALSLTYNTANPFLNPILVFRMVKTSIEYGVCNMSAFAFACYGAWLVSAPYSDFDGGYKMGRIATDLMKRLGAYDITPRLYTVVYTFINIWKEPFQASLNKHIEAFDIGSSTGDTEYALSNLSLYSSMAMYGCGENLEDLAKSIQSYTKRAIQCKQMLVAKTIVTILQLTLELMGIEDMTSYSLYFGGMNESSFFSSAIQKNQKSICRAICMKRKYVAFWSGDLDVAAQMYMLIQEYPIGSTGRTVSIVISTFIDGLIALYFARKNRHDGTNWVNIGESIIETVRQWGGSSSWNFSNKLSLLEAEHYFLLGDESNAISSYEAAIKAARDHRFVHEEGLAYEKAATFFLHFSRHAKALEYFMNAKRCYDQWGARALVKRLDKAIDVLLPMLGVA